MKWKELQIFARISKPTLHSLPQRKIDFPSIAYQEESSTILRMSVHQIRSCGKMCNLRECRKIKTPQNDNCPKNRRSKMLIISALTFWNSMPVASSFVLPSHQYPRGDRSISDSEKVDTTTVHNSISFHHPTNSGKMKHVVRVRTASWSSTSFSLGAKKRRPIPVVGYNAKDICEYYDRRPLVVGWRLNKLSFPLLGK